MLAVLLTGHGDVDRLQVRDDVPVPRPAAGEVLVRVRAAGVNNTDVNTRVGWYDGGGWTGGFTFPRIQGIDACGYIEAVGDGVDPDRIGERVIVEPCWREPGAPIATARFLGSEVDGAFAQYLVAPSRHAHRIDSTLSDVELASFPCSASTAENLLTRAGVGAGDRVLVTGASGGVGSAAVQLAAARGAHVTAVASAAKHAEVRALGAEVLLDRDEVPRVDGHDVVVDLVGGEAFPALLAALRPGGHYAVAGAIGGPLVTADLRTVYLKDLTLHGATVLDDGVFAALVRQIESGRIRPVVATTFPLERIVDAQAAFLEHRHTGKIVLEVP